MCVGGLLAAPVRIGPGRLGRVAQQLSPNLDLRTFRFGASGFGTNLVSVPAERAFYRTQVDVTNDLGVVVEVVAGLDLGKGEVGSDSAEAFEGRSADEKRPGRGRSGPPPALAAAQVLGHPGWRAFP